MTRRRLDGDRLARLDGVLAAHTAALSPPGAVWAVACGDELHVGVAGVADLATGRPMARDAVVRLSSMTKPLTAVAARVLVEECRLRVDDPVDAFVPELADRQVLVRPDGPLDDTVPAARPITTRDVLTFRPAPGPDGWLRRVGAVPLAHQPGERWPYHRGADLLGVLAACVAGQPFDVFLRKRMLEPLGMVDMGPADAEHRFGPLDGDPGDDGRPSTYDEPGGC